MFTMTLRICPLPFSIPIHGAVLHGVGALAPFARPAHNPAEQVEVLRWISWDSCHWQDAVSTFYFEHVVKSTFGFGTPDHAGMEAKVPQFKKYAKVLDAHLEGRTYVACGRLTIADFQLASMAFYWREAEMPMDGFPNLRRWLDQLATIPAWAHPWPAE